MSHTDSITNQWQEIAEGLRTELAEYGALLALFAEQQNWYSLNLQPMRYQPRQAQQEPFRSRNLRHRKLAKRH